MGNRKNGHRVYTQAEYEHFCFSGEPFTGYVEGIGYTCTEVVVTARQINRSGTEFVFDLSYVGYTFDINDMPGEAPQTLSQLEESRNRASGDPDRSKYWKIPTMGKFEYSDEGARQLLNPVAFIDNVAIELINSVVYLANSLINSGQVLYHEGAGSWWDYEWGGFKNQIKDIGDWGKGVYDYHTKTPARQQWTDFKKDISSIESLEKSTAFAGTLALGGYGMASKAGAVGRGTGMLTKVPAGAKTLNMFPSIRNGYGIFGKRGFIIKNHKIEAMYQNGGGGTVFSIKQIQNSGNLLRLDYGIHKPYINPYWHYHYRLTIYGTKFGSTAPRKIFLIPKETAIMGIGTGTLFNGESGKWK